MGRREFITILGGAAAWPLTARAQPPPRRVSVLMATHEDDADAQMHAALFRQGCGQLG
jgi:putative ABC transport system substrate-binding protein